VVRQGSSVDSGDVTKTSYYFTGGSTRGYSYVQPTALNQLLKPVTLRITSMDNAKLSFQSYYNLNYYVTNAPDGRQMLTINGFNNDIDYHNLILGLVTLTSESGKFSQTYELKLS
jgi:hypothetical protein